MQVFLGIGSNLGDRLAYLKSAVAVIQAQGILLARASSVYETTPWGYTQQPNFLNCVIEVEVSEKKPIELLYTLQNIENQHNRTRYFRYNPRTLDIDILSYGEIQLFTAELTLPHPRISERTFVLKPWAEVAPDFCLPGSSQTIQAMLGELPEERTVIVANPPDLISA